MLLVYVICAPNDIEKFFHKQTQDKNDPAKWTTQIQTTKVIGIKVITFVNTVYNICLVLYLK